MMTTERDKHLKQQKEMPRIFVPAKLHADVKIRAAKNGETMQDLMIRAIRNEVKIRRTAAEVTDEPTDQPTPDDDGIDISA